MSLWCKLSLVFALLCCVCTTREVRLTGQPPVPEILEKVECYSNVDPNTPIIIEVYSNWSPRGAERFVELVKDGYYDNSPLFRVVKVSHSIPSLSLSLLLLKILSSGFYRAIRHLTRQNTGREMGTK
jgi:hypothetical protein